MTGTAALGGGGLLQSQLTGKVALLPPGVNVRRSPELCHHSWTRELTGRSARQEAGNNM